MRKEIIKECIALTIKAYIEYFTDRMRTIQDKYDFDNLVINGGSGVTGSETLKGFMDYNNFIPKKQGILNYY